VTEPSDPSPHVVQRPRNRTDQVAVSDFTMLVRVSGQPEALQVFTDAQADEANQYAASTGGSVVPLPLAPPSGYAADSDGTLRPAPPPAPTCTGMVDGPDSDHGAAS
jgi:hypothetical protein